MREISLVMVPSMVHSGIISVNAGRAMLGLPELPDDCARSHNPATLTTALNSYGASASEAQRSNDVLFETVRLGKTHSPEWRFDGPRFHVAEPPPPLPIVVELVTRRTVWQERWEMLRSSGLLPPMTTWYLLTILLFELMACWVVA